MFFQIAAVSAGTLGLV